VKWRKVFLSVVLVLVVLCLSWASAVGACPPPQPPHMFWGRADEFEPGDTVEIFGEHGDLYAATEVVYSPLVWRGEAFGNVYWIDVPFDDPCTEVREGVVWEGGWFPTGECVPEQLTFKVNGQVVAKAPFGPPLVDLADVPGSTRLDLYEPVARGTAVGCVFDAAGGGVAHIPIVVGSPDGKVVYLEPAIHTGPDGSFTIFGLPGGHEYGFWPVGHPELIHAAWVCSRVTGVDFILR